MLPLAKSVRDRVEASYQAGQRSLIEVLDAQRTYRARLRISISNQTDYWQSLNKLNSAIGTPAHAQ
jgi:cobalt-zinc-cadmium efflux system outer membrane protein